MLHEMDWTSPQKATKATITALNTTITLLLRRLGKKKWRGREVVRRSFSYASCSSDDNKNGCVITIALWKVLMQKRTPDDTQCGHYVHSKTRITTENSKNLNEIEMVLHSV